VSFLQRGYDTDLAKGLSVQGMTAEEACQNKGERTDVTCPTCESPMKIQVRRRDGVPFLGCSRFPKCKKGISAWGDGTHVPKGDVTKEREDAQHVFDDSFYGYGEFDWRSFAGGYDL